MALYLERVDVEQHILRHPLELERVRRQHLCLAIRSIRRTIKIIHRSRLNQLNISDALITNTLPLVAPVMRTFWPAREKSRGDGTEGVGSIVFTRMGHRTSVDLYIIYDAE